MTQICVYPGTFDPITNGHVDIVNRAKRLFDKVVIAVAISEEKRPTFDIDFRVKMIKETFRHEKQIEVVAFDNLLVDFVKEKNIRVIIRGLRAVSDFEYELQIGYANASLWRELETVYLMPRLKNAFISSSIIRAIYKFNGKINHLVPKEAFELLKGAKCI